MRARVGNTSLTKSLVRCFVSPRHSSYNPASLHAERGKQNRNARLVADQILAATQSPLAGAVTGSVAARNYKFLPFVKTDLAACHLKPIQLSFYSLEVV